jgi:hypothetical protein
MGIATKGGTRVGTDDMKMSLVGNLCSCLGGRSHWGAFLLLTVSVSRISQMQVRAVRTLWEGLLRQSKLCRLFRWTLLMAICRELAVRALDAMSPSKMLLQSTVERERGRTVGEEGVLVSCSERIQHGSCWMKMCRGPTGWRLDVN